MPTQSRSRRVCRLRCSRSRVHRIGVTGGAESAERCHRTRGRTTGRSHIEDLGVERGQRTLRVIGNGNQPAVVPLVQRTARTIDLVIGERASGPILVRRDGQRLDRRTAHRWVRAIAKRAGIGLVHPHMLRAAFIMAALDAGVPLHDVQLAARHADPRTTTIYDRRRQDFDRHAAYVVAAFITGG
ncbi:MAG: tyrosine-type recombinase/integrase [Acidimicrobiia bacterium]